jgi:hypothetical protein
MAITDSSQGVELSATVYHNHITNTRVILKGNNSENKISSSLHVFCVFNSLKARSCSILSAVLELL